MKICGKVETSTRHTSIQLLRILYTYTSILRVRYTTVKQCCHRFRGKNHYKFTKKFTKSEKKITRFKIFASKLAVLLEMMYLFTFMPKMLYIICKFLKTDHVEAWKISY